jgi:hypothetical protein
MHSEPLVSEESVNFSELTHFGGRLQLVSKADGKRDSSLRSE